MAKNTAKKTKKEEPKEVLTSEVFFEIENDNGGISAKEGKGKQEWNQKLKNLVNLEAGRDGESDGSISPPSDTEMEEPAPLGRSNTEDMQDIIEDVKAAEALPDHAKEAALEAVHNFARYLGMDPVIDKEFLWIAVEAMSAALPENWVGGREFRRARSRRRLGQM